MKNKKRKTAEIEIEGGGSIWWHVCGECHGEVDENDRYCRHCGSILITEDRYREFINMLKTRIKYVSDENIHITLTPDFAMNIIHDFENRTK